MDWGRTVASEGDAALGCLDSLLFRSMLVVPVLEGSTGAADPLFFEDSWKVMLPGESGLGVVMVLVRTEGDSASKGCK